MALGHRKKKDDDLWVATTELPRSPGHPFYCRLNELLAAAGFDRWVEERCAAYYAEGVGRPSIPPGTYFRMILVGYFEGIGSQRGIAWRCHDSRSLAEFLGYGLTQATPDHSSLTRVSQRLPEEVHREVFRFVVGIAIQEELVQGRTVAVDATTLEANAAMKSIVRRDTGEDWNEYITRLMREAGVIGPERTPTAEEMRRFDKGRPDKRVSNQEWTSSTDADARIAPMKDGRTHLAYKAEHVVDLESDVVLAAEVYPADQGDPQTMCDSVAEAQINLREAGSAALIRDVAGDKGYHAAATLADLAGLGFRSYVPERRVRGRRTWTDKPAEQKDAVYANRRRVRGARGKRLQRLRSEMTERSFAHVCATGGARRCWLHGLVKVAKRYLMQVAARNLGRIMRKLFGIGTPRSLQGEGGLVVRTVWAFYWVSTLWVAPWRQQNHLAPKLLAA